MPATRTGRQSSPAKDAFANLDDAASPSKSRVQPMRSARLRSASPFQDTLGVDSNTSTASPSKRTRVSPSKKTSAPATPQKYTRSRSRSVLSDGLSIIDETEHNISPAPESDASSTVAESSGGPRSNLTHSAQLTTIPEAIPNSTLSAADDEHSTSQESSGDISSSASDSDSTSTSNPDTDTDEDDQDESVDLDALLRASEKAYKDRALSSRSTSQPVSTLFEDNQDMLAFNTTNKASSRKIPPLISIANKETQANSTRPVSHSKIDKHVEALANGSLTAQSVKRSKHARVPETSAGSNWFNMPEFGASSSKLIANQGHSAADAGHSKATGGDARLKPAQQLRQEVQAIRLRNALDPKRFYRASAKNQAMPKFAQLGKIIASPLEPKAVMNRKERGRTVVEELIRDAEAASYAKRKFTESQIKHKPSHSSRKMNKPAFKKRRS